MFDRVRVSKASWHYKLLVRMFGDVHFNNFCPYFWLVVFALAASPFFFTFVFIRSAFIFLVNLMEMVMEPLCKVMDFIIVIFFGDSMANEWYSYSKDYNKNVWEARFKEQDKKFRLKLLRRNWRFQFWKWWVGEEEWQERLRRLSFERIERQQNEYLLAKERKKSREQLMMKISIWTKEVAPVILVLAAPLVLFLLYKFGLLLSLFWIFLYHWLLGHGKSILTVIGIAAFIITISAIMLAVGDRFKRCDIEIPRPPRLDFVSNIFSATGRFIKELFSFVLEAIKMFKEKHCPSIEWHD